MKTMLLFITGIALSGCTTFLADKPFPLGMADPLSVRECRPIGTYPGPSGYRFWGPPPVLADFKYQTAVKAKDAGATHIFWREENRGYYGQARVFGYAFDCTGVTMPKYYVDPAPF